MMENIRKQISDLSEISGNIMLKIKWFANPIIS